VCWGRRNRADARKKSLGGLKRREGFRGKKRERERLRKPITWKSKRATIYEHAQKEKAYQGGKRVLKEDRKGRPSKEGEGRRARKRLQQKDERTSSSRRARNASTQENSLPGGGKPLRAEERKRGGSSSKGGGAGHLKGSETPPDNCESAKKSPRRREKASKSAYMTGRRSTLPSARREDGGKDRAKRDSTRKKGSGFEKGTGRKKA